MKVLVTPHHLGIDGLQSTAAAIEGLPGGHKVSRAVDGALILEDGKLIVDSNNPGFLLFSIQSQGYAKNAEAPKNPEEKQPELRNPEDKTEPLKGYQKHFLFRRGGK